MNAVGSEGWDLQNYLGVERQDFQKHLNLSLEYVLSCSCVGPTAGFALTDLQGLWMENKSCAAGWVYACPEGCYRQMWSPGL